MMLSHLVRRVVAPSASGILRRQLATPAAASAAGSGLMNLNFNLPQETLYDSTPVSSVVVPGAMGEYEVTADHVPIVAELKAGLLTIKHADGGDEKYFVPGGFSLTHEGSTTVREFVFCCTRYILLLVGASCLRWGGRGYYTMVPMCIYFPHNIFVSFFVSISHSLLFISSGYRLSRGSQN